MTIDPQQLRLDGVYPQRQQGFYMQRIKLPGGIISAEQAFKVAAVADRFARGTIHLTTRGSMELHWLTADDLPLVTRQLAAVGLLSRGACGGAVRGVVCNSLGAAGALHLEALVRLLHRHFSANPRFETLPKKFKIAVEADTAGGRHLIQDLALVPVDPFADKPAFNVWTAGGLGREPQPAFLLAEAVPPERIIGLVEAVVRVYAAHTPAGKRLKHLLCDIGQEEFRRLVMAEPTASEELPPAASLATALVTLPATPAHRIEVGVFAGELAGGELSVLAEFASRSAGGIMLVTGDQNIAFHVDGAADPAAVRRQLAAIGFPGSSSRDKVTCRVCPGSHECRVGLGPTREIAAELLDKMGPAAAGLVWAISGCHNSCAQPQLADAGVVISRLVNEGEGKSPRFDLYRREGSGAFAAAVRQGLTRDELLQAVVAIG